eukprot:2753312-Pyramimonas_sp.AAC.1
MRERSRVQAEGKAALDAAVSGLAEADRLRRATQEAQLESLRRELLHERQNARKWQQAASPDGFSNNI